MIKYYDGTKLLSLKDLNGNAPEIYLCTTNRSAGKTTYFSRLIVNRFLRSGKKFMLLYRFNYELSDISNKFFKDINTLFFPDYYMEDEARANGIFREMFLISKADKDSKVPCGYAVSMNSADQLKKYSHLFSDTDSILFDEFQSETNHYCSEEVNKFISIHTSVARGQGKQSRRVPVYMLGNAVTVLNPYYTALGIAARLKKDTHFMRGNGWVMESGFIESAAKAQAESAFMTAFSDSSYVAYAKENVYLNDSTAFIEKPDGYGKYLATINYEKKNYALIQFAEQGIIYCDDKPDLSYPYRIAVTTDDHQINYVMLKSNDIFVQSCRFLFQRGAFRFKNMACKEAVLKLISY